MLKRLATLLLGVGLIGLGVLLFLAPGGSVIVQWLAKLWPAFLILAGLVRVAGYLIDHHPRSPIGGMMITAVGGILLAANFRGDRSVLALFGQYWFFLLLAFIIGRVLRQYTHRIEDGQRTAAFSPSAIALMILIVGGGLTSNYLAKNRQYLNGVEFKLGNLGLFSKQFEIQDEQPQVFAISPNSRLLISGWNGDVSIASSAVTQATAKIIKRIRANSQEEANQFAKNLHLQITPAGKDVQFSAKSDETTRDFGLSLLIELPTQLIANVEANKVTGSVALRDLRGDQVIRDSRQIEVRNTVGKLTIENPNGSVELSSIQGEVNLANVRSNLEMREIKGAINFDARNGNVTIENSTGPVQARLNDVRLTINELAKGLQPASGQSSNNPPVNASLILKLTEVNNSRINLQEIKGAIAISAERSRIEAENIIGDLTVKNSSERVQVNRINGALKVAAENSTIEIEEANGATDIEATRDVTVRGFRGTLSVKTSSGTINLSTDEKLAGNLKASSERGRIHLSLPEDSSFKLDAGTDSGQVRVNGFEGITVPKRQKQISFEHNASANSPVVVLRSLSGPIELQSSGLALASRDDQ